MLYSNRSAAFLHLLKVQKALADAEEAIKLRPTWEKGYFRKAAVLEAQENYKDALDAYLEAAEINPKSADVASKIKYLSKKLKLTFRPLFTASLLLFLSFGRGTHVLHLLLKLRKPQIKFLGR